MAVGQTKCKHTSFLVCTVRRERERGREGGRGEGGEREGERRREGESSLPK